MRICKSWYDRISFEIDDTRPSADILLRLWIRAYKDYAIASDSQRFSFWLALINRVDVAIPEDEIRCFGLGHCGYETNQAGQA